MSGVWRVEITTHDGQIHDEFVVARTAADAAVVLGDRVRAALGAGPDEGTVQQVRVVAVADRLRDLAVNLGDAD